MHLQNRSQAHQTRLRESKALKEAKITLAAVGQAQEILQSLAQEIQAQSHRDLSRVVSKCLRSVFEDDTSLAVEFVRRRGKTEAEFVFLQHGQRINPRTTSGGLRQVSALALRLACLLMRVPSSRRLLVLDEPFAGLSHVNLGKMGKLVKTLAEELDLQILIVTHSEALEVGKVIAL